MGIEKLLLDISESKNIEPKGIFCWQWGEGERSMRCFGAYHEFGFNSQSKSIIEEFTEHKPDCIVVESYKEAIKTGAPLDSLVESIDENFKGNESKLGINLALKYNVSLASCEPLRQQEIKEMKSFLPEELLAFYVLRSLPFYERETSENNLNFNDFLAEKYEWYLRYIKSVFPDYNQTKDTIFILYKEWFKKGVHELSQEELEKYSWPTESNLPWRKSNEIAKQSFDLRDKFILEGLENLSKFYNKIFVIYGRSHIPRWENALCELYQVKEHKVIFDLSHKND